MPKKRAQTYMSAELYGNMETYAKDRGYSIYKAMNVLIRKGLQYEREQEGTRGTGGELEVEVQDAGGKDWRSIFQTEREPEQSERGGR